VNFDVKALEFAMEFAGTDHLLAGSDYPHKIGSLEKMVSSIGALHIPHDAKARIYGENAAGLLGQ
jgi:aminocarboxymuconate-semialdehyde decarboxylase